MGRHAGAVRRLAAQDPALAHEAVRVDDLPVDGVALANRAKDDKPDVGPLERGARELSQIGILAHICLKGPLETAWPKGLFLAELPGPEVRGGRPLFSYEQTSVIDPVRVINGDRTLVQSWLPVWCRDPDEAHNRELVAGV